jgi:tripartite-type tricarboxylate transporter receptor subunit TctC
MNRTRRTVIGFAAVLAIAGSISLASAFPKKSIEYVIPFGPGGESDIAARLQQSFFKSKFNEDLVISYKPGAGGATAWSELNTLPADGYTIMGVNLPHIILQPAQGAPGYETNDINPVYWFHYTPDALVVKAASPFQTLNDLVQYAKENPGKLTFSGSGKATANHLAHLLFNKMAGIQTSYVAFKGTGASNTALLGDQVEASWGYTTSAAAIGKEARILAIATETRHPRFPDTPTFKELGFDIVSGAYRGIAVPKATPEAIKKKLSDMIGQINADPEFRKRMADGGFAMVDIPLDKNAAFMKKNSEEFLAAAKEAGILKH